MLREEVVNKINELEKYFLRLYTEGQILFLPEYNASIEINKIIQKGNKETLANAEEIIKIYNSVNEIDHYNGSGWMDYQILLLNLIKQSGVNVIINDFGYMKINSE